MKNKMADLKNHLFVALERLNDDTLTDAQLKNEIERSKAISEIGKVLVDGAKTSLLHAKLTGKLKELDDDEFDNQPSKVKKLA